MSQLDLRTGYYESLNFRIAKFHEAEEVLNWIKRELLNGD